MKKKKKEKKESMCIVVMILGKDRTKARTLGMADGMADGEEVQKRDNALLNGHVQQRNTIGNDERCGYNTAVYYRRALLGGLCVVEKKKKECPSGRVIVLYSVDVFPSKSPMLTVDIMKRPFPL